MMQWTFYALHFIDDEVRHTYAYFKGVVKYSIGKKTFLLISGV